MTIDYVCLSDMHLGEEDSLLTALTAMNTKIDPANASPTMVALAACLEELICGSHEKRLQLRLI